MRFWYSIGGQKTVPPPNSARQTETGMEMSDLRADPAFLNRTGHAHSAARNAEALRRLAHLFSNKPEGILPELVDIAVEYCGADSAGISLEVPTEEKFRWVAVAGTFSAFLHGTTPRFFSPCGTCLDRGVPQLYRVSKPYYDYLGIEAEPITDGILIPWIAGNIRGTLWAVSHRSSEAFDNGDLELLESLADFAGIALRHQAHEAELLRKAEASAAAAMANELAHEINNPLQSLTNTIFLAAQGGEQAKHFAAQAVRDLADLSARVRELLNLPFTRG